MAVNENIRAGARNLSPTLSEGEGDVTYALIRRLLWKMKVLPVLDLRSIFGEEVGLFFLLWFCSGDCIGVACPARAMLVKTPTLA